MTFMNPKEQVIDLQLTQHGKYLLSQGKLNPVMYAFYDDDILYDSRYGGTYELQNEAEERIMNETPRLSTQYMFRGAETAVFSSKPNMINELMPGVSDEAYKNIKTQETQDSVYALQNPLGNSAFNSNKIPAWSVQFLKTQLKDVSYMLTGSRTPNVLIPQLECELKYRIHRTEPDLDNLGEFEARGAGPEDGDPEVYSNLSFSDGSEITIDEDFLFLTIEEANTSFIKENFDMEVFLVQDIPGGGGSAFSKANNKVLKKLRFLGKDNFEEATPDTFEYYFEMDRDEEIDPDLYCKLAAFNKSKNIFTDKIFKCPDQQQEKSVSIDIYNTGENEDVGEPC
jgi:hypothetical protein